MKVDWLMREYGELVKMADEMRCDGERCSLVFHVSTSEQKPKKAHLLVSILNGGKVESKLFVPGGVIEEVEWLGSNLFSATVSDEEVWLIDVKTKIFYTHPQKNIPYRTDYHEWIDDVVHGWGRWRSLVEKEMFRAYLTEMVEKGGVAKMFAIRDMLVWYKLWLKDEINRLQKEIAMVDGSRHPVYKFKLRLLMSVYGMVRKDIKAILNIERSPRKKNGLWLVINTSPRWLNKLFEVWRRIPQMKKHVVLYPNDERIKEVNKNEN